MPDVARLQAIHTFPMLVTYLRDELDWPITHDDFEDLTFEYEPEELGIERKFAGLIKGIRQLRPLKSNQPWGIFFINFDKEKLPVVMLRRILGALVVKKRASGERSQQASWLCNDLLFISTYGEEDSRSISFGHFREKEEGGLPTLRVVGWDKDSTQLRLEDAQLTLAERLRYPDDDNDIEDWRETWSSAFKLRPREVISTSKGLAKRLAEIAVSIRQSVRDILDVETEEGSMRELLESFRENLLHDLDEDGFADTYAQTLTYGLLSEKMIARLEGTSGALSSIKLTNPFLSELVDQCREVGREQQQIDFDELGVGELEELLDDPDTKLDEVLKDFGRTAAGEDPVIHFYEFFLAEYDPKERKQRGVFYTPKPVVSFIVRSVHELLQTEFGLADGLADTTTWGEMLEKHPELKLPPLTDEEGEERTISKDEPFVQILDPATGTATFLVETIEVIHQAMTERWKAEDKPESAYRELWNEYVPKHLLPRLHGYELMMAPYAIAHMKIGIKLYETGYLFKAKERARIYLTNTLEDKLNQLPEIGFDVLAREASAVNEIKWYKKFTVVIGNPPYSVSSSNNSRWIELLMIDYKKGLNDKNIQPLSDDYIKFTRYGNHVIEKNGAGVLAYITNNSFIDGLIHRQMRKTLVDTFDDIFIIDLHGNYKKRELTIDGCKDINVFDIQQGVSINILLKNTANTAPKLGKIDLLGTRKHKYNLLLNSSLGSMEWEHISPKKDKFFFKKVNTVVEREYLQFVSLESLFLQNGAGVQTKRDNIFVDYDRDVLSKRIERMLNSELEEVEKQELNVTNSSSYRLIEKIENCIYNDSLIRKYNYRAFDDRFIYYDKELLGRSFYKIMKNMLQPNTGLITSKQQSSFDFQHCCVTNEVTDHNSISMQTREASYFFPLYLYPEINDLFTLDCKQVRTPNLNNKIVKEMAEGLELIFTKEKETTRGTFAPIDILHHIYALLHSPAYRRRYSEFLKIDFPRLPLTSSLELFKGLANLGAELVALHLMEAPKVKNPGNKFIGPDDLIGASDPTVEKVSYSDETVWLNKNQTIGFEGVPEEVWNFHIGGYQVCHKWLKDRQAKGGKNPRPGRVLTKEDRDHYQGIIVSLSETIRIMAKIDEVIDQHGGWPDAFQTKDSSEDDPEAEKAYEEDDGNKYWLLNETENKAEGPYPKGELTRKIDQTSSRDKARICIAGEKEWVKFSEHFAE
jgi:predicted helicase